VLEARLLGQFDVRLDGQPVVISSRAAQSLLAYLLLNPGTTHRREKLAGLLWPDATDTNARRNLRQELWRLRKAFDASAPGQADLIASDDLSVGVNTDAPYWLDSAVLEKAANSSSD
jgi:DNA-binding SARP family transcriptional activator